MYTQFCFRYQAFSPIVTLCFFAFFHLTVKVVKFYLGITNIEVVVLHMLETIDINEL